ncbi:RagB/SusD family nutrient uptake outer membrane protein [Mucilaginibacter daejeonensis]|uniref:RagB/SusD family nutrient uptake outer membrane protein n=1 Tax=Mucilaginibacter daejeonensis TaxID=398049 RepID=UPI001D17820F|nr:RagB/SusD family nutrient uptake outer membrane protein [Mucilaginibacter daejeonensis]UEG52476.1 RagB/SusD family nutrient uptake outer membrane protein [Mucilaginibacter daejeonensis]
MKKTLSIAILLLVGATSCKKEFLTEKPIAFLSSSNAFITYTDFTASVIDLYVLTRAEFYSGSEVRPFDYIYGTDLVFDGEPSSDRHTNMVAAYNPTGTIAGTHWTNLYKIVAESNTIISRLAGSSLTDAQKLLIEAQARFYRGLAYRTLVALYGGVPLSLEEVKTPKTDYVRASKADCLNQVITDLKFAVTNLPAITAVKDGEINNLAASHLLSEVYLAAGQFQLAVDAATAVISNPNVSLMRTRFGSRSSVTPGDVYWDLFQQKNQNRSGYNNREGIWVIQFETDVIGGGALSTTRDGSYMLERHHAPSVRDIFINTAGTSTNVPTFLWPNNDYSGGRGIGWAVSTKYFMTDIWQSDFTTDIRNANHNFVRDYVCNNPASDLYKKVISTNNPPKGLTVPSRAFYAYQSKATTPFDHPSNLIQDANTGLLKTTAGATYTDQYFFRLAETYLLRAEAYLGLNNQTAAAADINVVRGRANASPVAAANVTIDYILDERMRELGVEEKRRVTLGRLGLLNDRVRKCNPYYKDMLPTYNLWPIPAGEIERNKDAKLEQNPGY